MKAAEKIFGRGKLIGVFIDSFVSMIHKAKILEEFHESLLLNIMTSFNEIHIGDTEGCQRRIQDFP